MKKLVSLLLALMMACMLLPAMAEEDLSGEWYMTEIAGMNPAQMGMDVVLTMNADGTASMTMKMGEESETQEGSWTLEGGSLSLTIENDTQAFTAADGLLTGTISQTPVVFSREKPEAEAVEFAEVKTDAQPEEFNGTWKATYVVAMGMSLPVDAAITSGQMPDAPMLTVEDGKIGLTGGGMDNLVGSDPMQLEFADGKYSYSMSLSDEFTLGMDLEMLQDGMLCFRISMGEEILLYFVKAE